MSFRTSAAMPVMGDVVVIGLAAVLLFANTKRRGQPRSTQQGPKQGDGCTSQWKAVIDQCPGLATAYSLVCEQLFSVVLVILLSMMQVSTSLTGKM